MSGGTRFRLASIVIAALVCANQIAATQERPQLHTNEAYMEDITRATKLAVDEPMAVFDFVFGSLPEQVKVYPTENYYYFTFIHSGVGYSGNIRLELDERGGMSVHFFYNEDVSTWRDEPPSWHVMLNASNDVAVEKIERFIYRITHHGKSVVFALNDLSQVTPPASAIGPDEKFLGPIFD